MVLLILGVVVWSGVHCVPAVAVPLRSKCIDALGPGIYQLVYSLVIFASLAMMIFGWRSAVSAPVYTPPAWGASAAFVLMVIMSLLFVASYAKTNLKRLVRHPQLSSVLVLSIAHLLANGDDRSLILFGGLGVWAIAAMILIGKRDGDWIKPDAVGVKEELLTVVVAAVVFAVFLFAHPYISGVALAAW